MKSFWLIAGIALVAGVMSMRGRPSCTACKLKPELTEAELRKIAESNKIEEPDFVKVPVHAEN